MFRYISVYQMFISFQVNGFVDIMVGKLAYLRNRLPSIY